MQRRDFFAASTAAILAPNVMATSNKKPTTLAEPKSVPKIDTHQHLWDLKTFQPPWLKGAPEVLSRSYVTSDYLDATRGLNVVKTVYMEVDVAEADQNREAQHVTELSKSDEHPTCGAVISGRPNSAGFEKYIRQYANSKYIRGVRQVLHVDSAKRGMCIEKQFVKSVQLLGELDKTFDLCMRPSELMDASKLAGLCPDTKLILDHCGNADPKVFLPKSDEEPWHTIDEWKRGLAAFAKHKNTYCKISGIIARAPKGWTSDHLAPIIEFCIETFGFDRIVFGGDWPVCLLGGPYGCWVSALNEVIGHHSFAARKKLYHDNAIKVYGI
ncbi:MAG: amidohydrolase [Planctomycetaceae bacterium]